MPVFYAVPGLVLPLVLALDKLFKISAFFSDAKQLQYWRKLAERGDPEGQFWVGWSYANGQGVLSNNKRAVEWYRKAAAQGHARSMFQLGWAHFMGEGAQQSRTEAYKYMLLAVAREPRDSSILPNMRRTLALLENDVLTTDQKQNGRAGATAWEEQFEAQTAKQAEGGQAEQK